MRIMEIYQMFLSSTPKKFIALVLSLLMLAAVLLGCSEGQNGDNGTQSADSGIAESEAQITEPAPEGEQVVIASNGKSDFTIWVANDIFVSYPDVLKQINDVAALIKNKTGAAIAVMSDSSYSVKASKNSGILIGNTKFAESKALNSEMKNKDYYVGLSGNKILIYGGDVDGVSKAVRYFYITVLNSQKVIDKTMVFNTASHTLKQTEKYDIDSITCAGTELAKFTIVIPTEASVNEHYFANALRWWLYQKYGYRMNIVNDSTTAAEHEILIGNTGRTADNVLEAKDFAVCVSNGNLCLSADGMLGYNTLYTYITETLLKAGGSVDYTLDAGFAHRADVQALIDDGSSLIDSKTGEVRIMGYNVFGGIEEYDDGTSTGPIELRQELQLEMIRTYEPDVVGFQEFTTNYSSVVAKMTDLGYEEVSYNSSVKHNNPLFFNNATLMLIDSGYLGFTGIDSQKGASWAIFRVRATGKTFVAVSTHFMWNSPQITADEADAARTLNATELLALVSEIRNSHSDYADIPVVMVGDYNCKISAEALTSIKNAGFECARDIAAQKNDSNGHHSYSRYDKNFEVYTTVYGAEKKHTDAIDHAFVSSGITVNSFAAVNLPYAAYASDHCPTVTDFTIN